MGKVWQKTAVFLLTFLAYVGLHSLRAGWSYSKTQLSKQFDISSPQLGVVDMLYLVSYSVGMATIGNLSSKVNLKYFIAVGMIVASVCYMSFSVYYLIWGVLYYGLVLVVMCFNGYAQSTGWPGMMAVMGNWFGKGKRGLLMGFWAINANVGNIFASVACNLIDQQYKLSWAYNFIFTGCFCILIAILIIICLKEKPVELQQSLAAVETSEQVSTHNPLHEHPIVGSYEQAKESILSSSNNESQQRALQKSLNKMSVLSAFCLPKVPFYVMGYACTKGCIYGMLFWLPTYLDNKGLGSQKGYISSMVDVGCFIGGLMVGYLGDRFSYRALFLSPFLFLGAIIMFLVSFALTNTAWTYYLAMLLIGLMIGGPYNVIGSAITIDLGEQAGKKNIAKVSALIEGCAAVFAAASQLVISFIPFEGIFYLFCGQCVVAGLVLLPLFLKDLKELRLR